MSRWRRTPFHNDEERCPIVCLGDGKFTRRGWRGKAIGHADRLRRALKLAQRDYRLVVVAVKESYTSKTCSTCGHRTLKNKEIKEHGSSYKLHGVLECDLCGRFWQRDTNASRNILAIAHLQVLNQGPMKVPPMDAKDNPDSRPLVFTKEYEEIDALSPSSPH